MRLRREQRLDFLHQRHHSLLLIFEFLAVNLPVSYDIQK